MKSNLKLFDAFKFKLNKLSPYYFIGGYLLLISILVFFKTKPYNFNFSSLIGIWKGFADLNSNLIDKNFVILYDGGYDGQFFYIIGKQLFTSGLNSLPVLDSFYLRFNRIGLPILSGLTSSLISFKYYPIITLVVLNGLHILSFLIIRKILSEPNKYLSLYYLFSPFCINSILLLVSDSLLAAFVIISVYFLDKYTIIQISQSPKSYSNKINSFFVLIVLFYFCLIKESGAIVLFSLLFVSITENRLTKSSPIIFAIFFYYLTVFCIKHFLKPHMGTNPLDFTELIDYPLFGFFKSINLYSITDIKTLFREGAKFPLFLFYILLILNLKNINSRREFFLFIPIIFILFTAGIGEVGYWLSFDNISRMFTLSIPWIILLKENKEAYNDYYTLPLSLIILILLLIRIIYLKTPMSFYLFS